MHRRMTITLDEEVYQGLLRVAGRGRISAYLERLARPHVLGEDLAAGYAAMAADVKREAQALEWCEALIDDVDHASR